MVAKQQAELSQLQRAVHAEERQRYSPPPTQALHHRAAHVDTAGTATRHRNRLHGGHTTMTSGDHLAMGEERPTSQDSDGGKKHR